MGSCSRGTTGILAWRCRRQASKPHRDVKRARARRAARALGAGLIAATLATSELGAGLMAVTLVALEHGSPAAAREHGSPGVTNTFSHDSRTRLFS